MKNWFFALLMVSSSVWARENEALRLAERLEYTVDSFGREALSLSYGAADPREAQKLVEISQESQDVRRDLEFRVVRELENGCSIDEAARNFEAIRPELQYTVRLAQALRILPPSLSARMSEMETAQRELRRAFQGGGGGGGSVSANCKETTESNVFTGAKTFVACSFRGRGLVKYEVILNFGSTKLEGHLYPELMDQRIQTEKVRAGLWPKFETYVTDRQGRRTLIAKN